MIDFIARYRATGQVPTLAEKIAQITDPAELDGVAIQLTKDGRDSEENKRLVATRRAEIAKGK